MMFIDAEEISRRSFVRRLFAIGAGVAASGSLIRQLELIVPVRQTFLLVADPNEMVVRIEPGSFAAWSECERRSFARSALIGIITVEDGQLSRWTPGWTPG